MGNLIAAILATRFLDFFMVPFYMPAKLNGNPFTPVCNMCFVGLVFVCGTIWIPISVWRLRFCLDISV